MNYIVTILSICTVNDYIYAQQTAKSSLNSIHLRKHCQVKKCTLSKIKSQKQGRQTNECDSYSPITSSQRKPGGMIECSILMLNSAVFGMVKIGIVSFIVL